MLSDKRPEPRPPPHPSWTVSHSSRLPPWFLLLFRRTITQGGTRGTDSRSSCGDRSELSKQVDGAIESALWRNPKPHITDSVLPIAMKKRRVYAVVLLAAMGVLAFFFLPTFPIGGSGTVVVTPYNGCDYSGCQTEHPVSLSSHRSAMASPAYHLFTCGESYFGAYLVEANMTFIGRLPVGNYSYLAEWYCGHYSGIH